MLRHTFKASSWFTELLIRCQREQVIPFVDTFPEIFAIEVEMQQNSKCRDLQAVDASLVQFLVCCTVPASFSPSQCTVEWRGHEDLPFTWLRTGMPCFLGGSTNLV
jgi:hypothetical protein